MTREPQAIEKSRTFRAVRNILIFNNLDRPESPNGHAAIACDQRFAQARLVRHSNQQVANAEHRPASRPGAD